MSNLPHLVSRIQANPESSNFKLQTRDVSGNENPNPYYTKMRRRLQNCLNIFNQEKRRRRAEKSPEIALPENIEYVEFRFFGPFKTADYENFYRENFGLSPVKFWDWNQKGLFTIVDEYLFENQFLPELNRFIQGQKGNRFGYGKITFIDQFEFLTTEKILESYNEALPIVYFSLTENPEIFQSAIVNQKQSLKAYLQEKGVTFQENSITGALELRNVNPQLIHEIAQNFDVVNKVTACSAGIIGPSEFGIEKRRFPFTIYEPNHDIPTVGVLDTGVSAQTPLHTILINRDDSLSLKGNSPLVDDDNHGTAVAGFTALGDRVAKNIEEDMPADAKILSIKIHQENRPDLLNNEVEGMVRQAVNEGVRLFVLTVCYTEPLSYNAPISSYAYMLDRLAYELDILFFIAVGNIDVNENEPIVQDYPDHFLSERTNILPPAESMNNLSIGAIGENFLEENERAVQPGSYPAVYSRTHHVGYLEGDANNKRLLKPDLLYHGGNYENRGIHGLTPEGQSGLQFLSAEEGEYFWRHSGTSFSTPLVANMAARILAKYPNLRLSTVKALIVNSAENIRLSPTFDHFEKAYKRAVTGNGKPNLQRCLYSSENEVCFILESEIEPNTLRSYKIRLPDYFSPLQKDRGIIAIEATLCFPFEPIPNNFLAYCPIHMGYGFFQNKRLIEVDEKSKSEKLVVNAIRIKDQDLWSQDAWGMKNLFSNCQKGRWTYSRQNLSEQNNTFKLGVNCRLHSILNEPQKALYQKPHSFSMVIRVVDQATNHHSNNLYDEIRAINHLEVLNEADIEIEGEGEAEAEY